MIVFIVIMSFLLFFYVRFCSGLKGRRPFCLLNPPAKGVPSLLLIVFDCVFYVLSFSVKWIIIFLTLFECHEIMFYKICGYKNNRFANQFKTSQVSANSAII